METRADDSRERVVHEVTSAITSCGGHGVHEVVRRAAPHLTAPGLHVAPVRDVAQVNHDGQIQDRVAEHRRPEGGRVLPRQVPRQEAAVGAAHDGHPPRVHRPCAARRWAATFQWR